MNTSSGQPCVSVCCKQDNVDPPGTRCYWNVSFSTEETSFPKLFDPLWATRIGPKDLTPRLMIPCPGNTVCYSDCNPANNISMYFSGNDFTNDSIDGGLTCRLDAQDFCFKSHVTDGTTNFMTACKTFLDLVANIKLAYEQLSFTIPFFTYTMSISLPFLAATFLVYSIVPELKNLHGLILRTYLACCFGYYLSMVIIYTNPNVACSPFIVIPLHFAFLSTFFWLNVMSFDIWWTFRSMRDCAKQSPRKKYMLYSLYAWATPVLIIGVGLIIEFVPDVPKGIIRPGLHAGCWIEGDAAKLVYLTSPMTMTIACNICFFVLAAMNITQQKKATAQSLEGSDSRRYNDEKSRFYLYLKLFIVMGMTWFSEVLGAVTTFNLPRWAALLLNLANNVQGLILFILFVWNARTRRLLSKRLGLTDWPAFQWISHSITRITTILRRSQGSGSQE